MEQPDQFTRDHLRCWLATAAPIEPGIDPETYAVAIEKYLDENDEWERAQFEGWSWVYRAAELEGCFDFEPDDEPDDIDGDDYWEDHDIYGGGSYIGGDSDLMDEW